ncbi:hypothetical protein ES703_50506 [subsurface metagenome]
MKEYFKEEYFRYSGFLKPNRILMIFKIFSLIISKKDIVYITFFSKLIKINFMLIVHYARNVVQL